MTRLELTALLALLVNITACVPNLGRTNARLEDGFDFTLSGGPAIVGPGEGTDPNADEAFVLPELEIDLQYAKQKEDQSGLAIQLKMPATFVFTTLDGYMEFASRHPHYFGFGVEAGLASSLYGVYSYYFTKQGYVTFTPRIHYYFGSLNSAATDSSSRAWVNPQIAVGYRSESAADTSVFFSYNRLLGKGADFCVYECDSDTDYRNQFFVAGISARF